MYITIIYKIDKGGRRKCWCRSRPSWWVCFGCQLSQGSYKVAAILQI